MSFERCEGVGFLQISKNVKNEATLAFVATHTAENELSKVFSEINYMGGPL